jgi:hypothetical protein
MALINAPGAVGVSRDYRFNMVAINAPRDPQRAAGYQRRGGHQCAANPPPNAPRAYQRNALAINAPRNPQCAAGRGSRVKLVCSDRPIVHIGARYINVIYIRSFTGTLKSAASSTCHQSAVEPHSEKALGLGRVQCNCHKPSRVRYREPSTSSCSNDLTADHMREGV